MDVVWISIDFQLILKGFVRNLINFLLVSKGFNKNVFDFQLISNEFGKVQLIFHRCLKNLVRNLINL